MARVLEKDDTRLLGADFLRAVACLAVVFNHLAQRMSLDADFGWLEPFRVFAQVGALGVCVFFVLSGYLLSRPFWLALDAGSPMPSIRTYVLRRAARIVPGCWLALVVSFVLSVAVFGAQLDGTLVLRFVSGLLFLSDWHWLTLFPVELNSPLWSISFEVTSYVLLPLGLVCLFTLRSSGVRGWTSRAVWLAVIGAVLLLHLLFMVVLPVDDVGRGWQYGLIGSAKEWMPMFNPFSLFAIFAIGALAGGCQVLVRRIKHGLADAVMATALVLAALMALATTSALGPHAYGWLLVPYAFPMVPLALGAVLAAGPSSLLLGRLLDNRVSRYIARVSFGIYIWHFPILELVRVLWDPQFANGAETSTIQFAITSLIALACTFLVATVSFYAIEQPMIRWARKLESR